jgi:DNA-binding response OmpR family regulator
MLRRALRRFFERQGWIILEASDGEVARGLLLRVDAPGDAPVIDVIVADRRMPRLGGMELHDALTVAEHPLAAHFVLASGDPDDGDVQAFGRRTGCPIVAKPFALTALLETVSRHARR